jgi:methylase of polypeptide subunit release factors
VIVFNPPYVVTADDELNEAQETKGIAASWAGGQYGIQVLKQFVP